MICVTRELGANIAKFRKRASITQQRLADDLTETLNKPVSLHMVSAWERGLRDIPAAVIPSICHIIHCTSWDIYPHSTRLTDRDVRLIETVTALSDEEKDDLYYLLHEWHGDRKALLKLDVIHAVQDESLRYEPDGRIIESYRDAIKRNDPRIDRRAKTDLAYVLKARRKLLEDDREDACEEESK